MNDQWSKIYDEHGSRVRAILFRMCMTPDLDDLVQECFVKVWRNLPEFRREASLKTWITRIAINTAHDYLRRKKIDIVNEEIGELELEAPARVENEQGQMILNALNTLSVPHREVLVLSVLEEHTLEEIAEMTGIPVGTVKSRLFHAREQMKRILQKSGVQYE